MNGGRTPAHLGAVPLGGVAIPYALYRVRARKRLSILVNHAGEVEVRGPARTAIRHAESFLRENEAWILNRLQQARERLAVRPALEDGASLPLLDGVLTLRLKGAHGGAVRQVGGELWLPGEGLDVGMQTALLEGWYRERARRHLAARLDHWSAVMGVTYGRLAIRAQKTRWGSCSSKGNINLNWRLLFAPSAVADYVVVHELCHLRHPDHSPDFWGLVAHHVPDHRALRDRLRAVRSPW